MRVVWCAVVLMAGCLRPNPGFDGATTDGDASGAASEGSTATTTGGPPTTGTTSTTTDDGTSAITSTSSTTGTTAVLPDMSSGTSTSTGGEPTSCWELGIDAWTVEPLLLDPPGLSPVLAPDALTLYWRALIDGQWHIIRSERADVDAPFAAGASFWPSTSYQADSPAFVAATQELFFAGLDDIYVVQLGDDAVWGPPAVAGGAMAFGAAYESNPNLTADGATLLFQRGDGPGFGDFNQGFNFYQLGRVVGQDAVFPNNPPLKVTPSDPGFGILACPALSSDGLRLFFAALDSDGGGFGDPNDGRAGVWYGERDSVGAGSWDGLTRSEQLREEGFVTCPVSVSADGCHLTLALFVVGQGTYETRLARRVP